MNQSLETKDKQKQFKKLFPKGWRLERVYQVTDPKGNPRAWSNEFGVALLMAHKALAYDRNAPKA